MNGVLLIKSLDLQYSDIFFYKLLECSYVALNYGALAQQMLFCVDRALIALCLQELVFYAYLLKRYHLAESILCYRPTP